MSSAMSLQRLQGFRLSCEDVKSSISIITATTSNSIGNKLWNSSSTFVIGVVFFFSSRKELQNPNLRRDLFLLLVQLGSIYY
jgi:hypothetical protein